MLKLALRKGVVPLLGLRRARHLGRWLCMTAGGEGTGSDWNHNGERYLVHQVLIEANARCRPSTDTPLIIVEIGSNHGQQTEMLAEVAKTVGVEHLAIHAFEPSTASFTGLSETVARMKFDGDVVLNRKAVGEVSGARKLYCFDNVGGGISTMYERTRDLRSDVACNIEDVQVTTVDEYARDAGLARVALMKIDTEGNDLRVLSGAGGCLAANRIDYVQFEYNSTWIGSRTFLRDAFDLLTPLGYRLGKLHPDRVEYFEEWNYRLEWFEQSNYVAWRPDITPEFAITSTEIVLRRKRVI